MVRVSPSDVQDGDAFAVKIVAVAGPNNTWFAARGVEWWDNQMVADSGDVLSEEQANPLFYVMRTSGRKYFEY